MPKYFKIKDQKNIIYVAIDDSGAAIIKDSAGRKVFLSRYQAKLMKFGVENLIGNVDSGGHGAYIEEITKETFEKVGENGG